MTIATRVIKTSISVDGHTATIRIPITFHQRTDGKQILTPPGAAP